METEIGYIDRSELSPDSKDTEVCMECRLKGLNLCDIDEICQMRLASALGSGKRSMVDGSLEYASEKGLIEVRTLEAEGNRPKRFIKITEQGKLFFGIIK